MDGNTAISILDVDPEADVIRAAYGEELFDLQLRWEATMWEAGAEAVSDKLDKREKKDKADQTPGGRAVLFAALASVEAGFDRWQKGGPLVCQLYDEAATTSIAIAKPGKRGPKPNTDHLKYLARLSAREIASITLRCMIKGLSRNSDDNGLDQIGVRNAIMHAVEAAARRAMFASEQEGANLLHHIDKDNQRNGYSTKARRKRLSRTFDERFSAWWEQEDMDHSRRAKLAQWLMVGAIENANPRFFERLTYNTEKKQQRTIIVPTEHLLKVMRDRNTYAELHSPLVLLLRDNQDENRATIRMRMDCRRQTEVRA